MKYFIIFPAVLLWVTARGADDTLLQNTDFPGNDLKTVLTPSPECCQLYCTGYPRCTFFTHVSSFTCYLKHTDSKLPPQITQLNNAVSGYPLTTVDPSSHSCFERLYNNVDFLGNDIKVILSESPNDCQDACTNYQDCQFFTYITPNFVPQPFLRKICFMKFSNKLPTPPVINILHGVVSGYSQRDCSGSSACDAECADLLIIGKDFPGNDFSQVLAPDAEHCQLLCTQHPRCQFFTFLTADWTKDNRRFFCYLKRSSSIPGITALSNVISGFSLRSFGLNQKCSNHVFKNLDFPGNDHKVVKVESDTECQQLCTHNPYCQFYTYVRPDFVNVDQRQNCYMKNIYPFPTPPRINDLKDVVSGFPENILKPSQDEKIPSLDADFAAE